MSLRARTAGPHAAPSARPNGFWGMAIFLVTDAVMFTLLLVANIYLRRHTGGDPQALLDPAATLRLSLGLWASSLTLVLAERLRASPVPSGLLYLLTGALGLVFVFGQVQEYGRLMGQGATVASDLFYTGFYTVTGLHGLHVLLGALLWLVLGLLRLRGRLGRRREGLSAGLGLYWHFVDAVWVILYVALYLWRGP